MSDVRVTSHCDEAIDAMKQARLTALEAIGSKAAGYALMLSPADTGRLRNSITWVTQKSENRIYDYQDDQGKHFVSQVGSGVPDDTVVIGTNVEYAIYQELGTSLVPAHPYLRPALERHLNEYKRMFQYYLQNA